MAKRKNSPLTKAGDCLRVDARTGEAVPIEGGGLRLLPPPPGKCEWCATAHDPGHPHNLQSLYYQVKFRAIRGRDPTWTDAMAHCTPGVRLRWRAELLRLMTSHHMEIPEDLRDPA